FAGSGDKLSATVTGTNITASFLDGVLSLTGTDTIAHYQQVLRSVTFSSGDDPDNGGASGARQISLAVDDGGPGGISAAAVITVNVAAINDAPSGAGRLLTIHEDGTFVFSAADFGFGDADGNSLAAVKITTLPGRGHLTNHGAAVAAGQFVSLADI